MLALGLPVGEMRPTDQTNCDQMPALRKWRGKLFLIVCCEIYFRWVSFKTLHHIHMFDCPVQWSRIGMRNIPFWLEMMHGLGLASIKQPNIATIAIIPAAYTHRGYTEELRGFQPQAWSGQICSHTADVHGDLTGQHHAWAEQRKLLATMGYGHVIMYNFSGPYLNPGPLSSLQTVDQTCKQCLTMFAIESTHTIQQAISTWNWNKCPKNKLLQRTLSNIVYVFAVENKSY